MTFQVQRILELPVEALAEMQSESRLAGFRAIDRLINNWTAKTNRFDCPGEVLLIAQQDVSSEFTANDNRIIGVCGLNYDPYVNSSDIGRVRHLYVMQNSRRQGVGRALVEEIIREAKRNFVRLNVRTTNPIAAQFYQTLGFTACASEFVTHFLDLKTLKT
jgi:GNAT superfamily N-acetyltransferase